MAATLKLVIATILALAASAHGARQLRGAANPSPSPARVGGYVTANVADSGVVAEANWVRDQVNAGNALAVIAGRSGNVDLIRITSAGTQVVAGINYKLALVLRDAAGQKYAVDAVVYNVPWMQTNQLTSFQSVKKN